MRVKKEYVILAGLILILAVYLILSGGKSRMRYEIPRLEKVEKNAIDRIELKKGERKIVLSGKGENWKIMPLEYPADPDRVKNMLEAIESLTLTELASEKKDYERYELDEEKKIQVKAYRSEKVVREFDIGKPSSTYRHTFVRVGDDPQVYHARESFRSAFDYEVDDLRDKVVMKIEKGEISELTIRDKEHTLHLIKKKVPVESESGEKEEMARESQEEEAWVAEDGTRGNKGELDSLLNQASDLRCDKFIEGKAKKDFQVPAYSILLKGAKEYWLWIFAKDEAEDKYPAVSSENAYPFFLSSWKAENIMKKLEDLKGKE